MTILDEIIAYKRTTALPRRKQLVSPEEIRARALAAPPARDFSALLRRPGEVAIIAEAKKASPSRGLLCPDFDPLRLAEAYVRNGATGVSVLTEEHYFQGSIEYLEQIAGFRAASGIPFGILRKDFVIDAYQVYETRAAGADALLLIVAVLSDTALGELLALTHALGLQALLETHDRVEVERALASGARLIGANNRTLHDFSVDLNTCLALRSVVPADACFVAESGIRTRADVERLGAAGVDAVLVGESLVTARDPGAQVGLLAGVRRSEGGGG